MQITTMSPFATSSRDPRLEHREGKTFFICEARKRDNSWTRSEVELDSFIGNEDGKFSVTGKDSNFTQSAQNIRLERGPGGRPVLCASLRDCAGEWRDAVAYPSDWLVNLEGRIVFGRQRDVRKFEVISDDRTFFICQTQRPDGSWGEAKIDLDKVIGNEDGKFDTSGGGKNFTHSAKDIHMRYEGANNDIRPILVASLKNVNGEWRTAEVDLLEMIKNVNGALEFHGRNHHGPQ